MYIMMNILLCFLVMQGFNNVLSQNVPSRTSCVLPPHPSFGWWSYVNQPSQSSPGLTSVLRIQCEKTYRLDGCSIVACIDGKWMPNIGKCLKTCPSIYSTSTLNVTCTFKNQETVNCTEPIEGTLAQFQCAAYYEDTRLSKSKALCIDGNWSEKIPECSPVCGKSALKKPTLIVNGDKTKRGDFPWQIALYTVHNQVLICGGTLLSERVVLTAAHCIADDYGNKNPKEQFVVVAGKYYRKFDHPDDRTHIQVSEILDMVTSDKYEGEEQNYEGDIAIIITKITFKFSHRIQPVCIDWARKFEGVVLNSGEQKGYVSGWGNTKTNSEPASELKSLSVPSIPRQECRRILPEEYRRYLSQDKFCAGYKNNGTSVCGGDSGGGLVFKKEGRFFIAGVVSLAPLADVQEGGCDTQQYTLYTLVYIYIDNFILKKLAEFKPDEVCKNCTVGPASTEKPTTTSPKPTTPSTKPVSGGCVLPQHPQSGRWSVMGFSSKLSPGNDVLTGTIIKVTCDKNYKYSVPDLLSICLNGTWTPKIEKCLKTCPPLHDRPKIEGTCTFDNKYPINCTEAVDGTVARFKCRPFYELANLVTQPSICINGQWSYLPECVEACGRKSMDPSVPKEHNPWKITLYDNNKTPICLGTLIGSKVVITGAHCVTNNYGQLGAKQSYTIAAGKYHREFNHPEDVDAQFSKPGTMLIASQYKGYIDNYFGDIAVIVVEKPFILSKGVQPVCMDWTGSSQLDRDGLLSGWSLDKSSWVPKEYKFDVMALDKCEREIDEDFLIFLTKDKFCAKSLINDTSLCRENTGAGVVFKKQRKYYLGGVYSLRPTTPQTEKCDLRQHALFTRVGYHNDFILDVEVRNRD